MMKHPCFIIIQADIALDLNLVTWSICEEDSLKSRIQFLYAILFREVVTSFRQMPPLAVQIPELTGRETFVLLDL